MRLVYVDEAGTGDDVVEPATVVAAVIVNGDTQWKLIESDIDDIRKVFPKLNPTTELKANKMFWNRDEFKTWSRDDTTRLQLNFLDLIRRHNLVINVGVVDRNYFKTAAEKHNPEPGESISVKPQDFALVMCLHETESWFCKNAPGEVGIIIADESDRKDSFKNSLRLCRREPLAPFHPRFNHLIEPILFTDSKEAWGTQLADHCAFFIKRMLGKKNDANQFIQLIKPHITDIQVFEPKLVN